MLDIKLIRENPDFVRERLAHKQFKQLDMVDQISALDAERRSLQQELDTILNQSNLAAKAIGGLMKEGKKEEAEAKKAEVAGWKEREKTLKEQLGTVEQQQQDIAIQLPNLPAAAVPAGTGPEDNEVVREGGIKPELPADAVPHWDLIKKFDLIDFETGAKITGSGFPLYKGKGAKLQRALVSYFLDYNTAAGYTEYIPPYMVNAASAHGTGQLPDKEGQMYYMPADDLYMIPTAEVPVTNVYRDVVLKESDLPLKMTAFSQCFRREAGSFGAQVRGLNRVHQFEKVEIIQIAHPERSHAILDEMVAHVEKLVLSLELPYRILRLCGGDMGFASAITYDFEVWSAAQQRWLEVSSVSNFESFQANRMKCRFKNEAGKTQLVHTLNGSSLALPRIVAALLENNQTAQAIHLPKVLHPYFGSPFID
ncbi:MAG: serine--tRNA ligase [Chitinophagaceae bacterium]|jgi:seryl-tRNA synthetase|nr:serine--tRNA ligase [Chitinophagaceae bacterium]